MLIKHEAKSSALLASRPNAEYFIFHIARARLCFNIYVKTVINFSTINNKIVCICLTSHCIALAVE